MVVDSSIIGNSAMNSPSTRDAHCVQTFWSRTWKLHLSIVVNESSKDLVTTWICTILLWLCVATPSPNSHTPACSSANPAHCSAPLIFVLLVYFSASSLLRYMFFFSPFLGKDIWRQFGGHASRCLAMCGNQVVTARPPSFCKYLLSEELITHNGQ